MMVFKTNLSKLFHAIILVCVISITVMLFSGCDLFQPPQDISQVQEEITYDSVESEVVVQEEEMNQEEIAEEEIQH